MNNIIIAEAIQVEAINNKCIPSAPLEEIIDDNIIDVEITENGISRCERYQPNQIFRCIINDNFYTGHMRNNKMHGKGTCEYNNGDIYEGHFSNDLPNGKGIYKYHNGDIYDGHFSKGLKHVFGILTYSDGSKIKGTFENDKVSGNCKKFYNDGKLEYEGSMKLGLFHGYGKYYQQGGFILYGRWIT